METPALPESELRKELTSDLGRGVTQLAELASRRANNRDLVYRAVLLKRELSHRMDPPSPAQIDEGIAILDALIADQARAAASSDQSRHEIAEAARSRSLEIEVPRAVVFECQGLQK